MADDDFDVLAMYTEEDQDDSAATAVAKKEAKEKRRQNFQIREQPTPPLSPRSQANLEMSEKLWEYDPKTGSSYYTRIWFLDFTKFDIDEETQFGPMHFRGCLIREGHRFEDSINVLCLKIMSSDVGFPINVYGTVIIRDSLDLKCNYLFRRDRENCQLIESQGDSLILTGPSRGVVFRGDAFYEIDLKIREEGEEKDDRRFNKAFHHVAGLNIQNMVERLTFEGWLSEVELVFAHVKNALEGTIVIKILSGPESFVGKITAYTTDLHDDNEMLLYDGSGVGGAVTNGAGSGGRVIQLFRHVVAVSADQMLVFRFWDGSACISPPCTCWFAPLVNGVGKDVVPCGPYKLRVKVVWSPPCGRR